MFIVLRYPRPNTCDQFLTVKIVDFEKKHQFFVRSISGKLVHCFDEFGHWNATVFVSVENSERSFHKKWLQEN